MTLQQFQSLKTWHARQGARHPVERALWSSIVTAWLVGWVGLPAACLLASGWAVSACVPLLMLPGGYVGLRRRLHATRRLRCDWIVALR